MKCKETEKMIPIFLDKKMNVRQLDLFLDHVENCEECMEELTIQYLVRIGTSLIEEGKSFDLRHALNDLLVQARSVVKKWKILMFMSYIAEIITFIIMIIILIMVIFV